MQYIWQTVVTVRAIHMIFISQDLYSIVKLNEIAITLYPLYI